MRRAALIVSALALMAAPAHPLSADPVTRAASVSVCTDQFLLTLADPSEVAAVSWQATDVRSPVRTRARGLPRVFGQAEELIAVDAGLVLFDPYGHPRTASQLERLDVRVERLAPLNTLDDVEAEMLRLGAALGESQRAEELVLNMRTRRAALAARSLMSSHPRALYVTPGGGGAGSGTFVHEVMELAGFENLQAELGHEGWGRVPLEELISTPPDVLILSFFETADPSLLDNFARHPLYRQMLAETPQIRVPAAPWVCAGPYLLDAAELLADERESLFPAPQARLP